MKSDISVAIIFKNEIRCIERCLMSLQHLRERLSVQIVMADTGSIDGSRAVAERYADIVFDFPWINDFAAARNAVLERCSGSWILTLDCDEWLDGNLDELTAFVHGKDAAYCDGAYVLVRNYSTTALDRYMDIILPRLMRADAHPRYVGAIHEAPVFSTRLGKTKQLQDTILHHDGYVMLNDGSAEGVAKRERNAALLRIELQKTPDDLRRLLQYLESANGAEDYVAILRHAVALIVEHQGDWQRFGAAILRHAVFKANNSGLPELDDWIDKSHEMFPSSYYTRIDVTFILFVRSLTAEDAEAAIRYGESFLRARRDFFEDHGAYTETAVSFLQRNDDYWSQYVRFRLAEAYMMLNRINCAMELLEKTEWSLLDARHTRYFLELLARLEVAGSDTSKLLTACRVGLDARQDENANECRAVLREVTTPPEILQLATKVKAILNRYSPDNPAVRELKNSVAYKKIAHLIEE